MVPSPFKPRLSLPQRFYTARFWSEVLGELLVSEHPLNGLQTVIVLAFSRKRSQLALLTLRKSATFPCEEALNKKRDDCTCALQQPTLDGSTHSESP